MRDFTREDFARFHPAGSLGRQLSKVDDLMRSLTDCRLALESQSVREVFVDRGRAGRRTGAIMLTDGDGRLAGLFTDSDLARLFENHRDQALDRPIREVMTSRPCTVPQGSMTLDAVAIMAERKISELPVIDDAGRPQGLIDITDVVGLFPESFAARSTDPVDGPVLARLPVEPRPAAASPQSKKFPPRSRA
jgi:arabinose-5-phosphate isomerase